MTELPDTTDAEKTPAKTALERPHIGLLDLALWMIPGRGGIGIPSGVPYGPRPRRPDRPRRAAE
ncbi:hypothetical protein [Nonomuraea dietziae]|uniref:hypothetical protein n=1 Tax=Nonomuraea dietziae TaxID=65515 RepID=UPI0033CB391D